MSPSPAQLDPRAERIRALNDRLRMEPFNPSYGTFVVTAAVDAFLQKRADALSQSVAVCLWQLCQALAAFGPDNDPHGEHDFGFFTFLGQQLFFKIDYYDPTLQWGSDDPADPLKTRRVLTIGMPEDL